MVHWCIISLRGNNEWKYKAVALESAIGQRLNGTDKGCTEVEELRAVLLATQQGANHIYTDSYDVFKGATKWIGHCTVND